MQGRDFLYPLRSFAARLLWEGKEGQVASPVCCPPWAPAMLLSPQMAMLLKLQEAANYIESPDRETMVDPDLQSTL